MVFASLAMLILRTVLVFIWIAISCTAGLVLCLLRWRHLDNNSLLGRMIAFGTLPLLRVRVEARGLEHLESAQPCVYVANHQHALDVAVCGTICPRGMVIIGKKELKWIPFFGLLYVAAGNVLIDRKNRTRAVAGLGETLKAMQGRGASVFMFPEGTRNTTAEPLLPFKKGAFHLAIEAQVPVVPIVIAPLRGLKSWLGRRRTVVTIQVLPSIPTRGLKAEDMGRLLTETREKMLEAFHGLKHPADHP